jgi:AP endonuclease-2
VPYEGGLAHILDIMNPPGVFKDGERQQEYTSRFMLPASGRLLPEFDVDKRRSIKDMFTRKPPSTLSRSSSAASALEKPVASQATEFATPATLTPNESLTPSMSYETQLPKASPLKRSQPPSSASSKRSKPTATPSAAGQKSLMGFFKPKSGDGA